MLAVFVSAGVLLAAGVIDRAHALDAEYAATIAELSALAVSTSDAAQRTDDLEQAILIAQDDTADRTAVLDVRPDFVAEIASLSLALDRAEGKVDTAEQEASARSAQLQVLAELSDPAVVIDATATVQALTDEVDDQLAAWEAEQQALSDAARWGASGADGYARVRAALDRVGGRGVPLYESASCAGGTAPACANSDGYIKYRADIADWSVDRLNWAMAHELAHIYQFRAWDALQASSSYQAMFGGDPEFLANCMAVVRGFPGAVGCSGEQQAWASGVWAGAVR
ncbi:MAG: hypothetical protein QM630_06200 [Microbacterium sp.]